MHHDDSPAITKEYRVTVQMKYPQTLWPLPENMVPEGRPVVFAIERMVVERDTEGFMTVTFTGCEPVKESAT